MINDINIEIDLLLESKFSFLFNESEIICSIFSNQSVDV
jgi:hypothetical protein